MSAKNYMDKEGLLYLLQKLLPLFNEKSNVGHTHDTATASSNGFMSASDKAKLDEITVEEIGDMLKSVYDPNGRSQDIFAYADSKIEINTSAEWAKKTSYIPPRGTIVIYEDYKTVNDVVYPAIKVADGSAYIVDQPFVGDDVAMSLLNHITDKVIHVTNEERDFWNNKVSCYYANEVDGNLVFTTEKITQ